MSEKEPAGERPPYGTWCHVEIGADDVARAKKFYGDCFGWTFRDIPEMEYALYETGEGGIGGGMMKRNENMPRQMVNYAFVEDVEASAKRVEECGGAVVMEKTEVPGAGWFSVVSDPEGNVFGIWQGMGKG